MAQGKPGTTLIAFESGHYKEVKGEWKGDSVWSHFQKTDGGMIHVNKDKVEYTETFGPPSGLDVLVTLPSIDDMIDDLVQSGVLRRKTTDPAPCKKFTIKELHPEGRPPRTKHRKGGKK